MSLIERLGNWYNVFDKEELNYVLNQLRVLYKTDTIMPASNSIFKTFEICPFDKCKVIMLFQDPYPQKNVATGIAVGNAVTATSLSPSLRKLKEAVPDLSEDFDNTLESWCKQGVLMLNSSLTVKVDKPNSHALLWRPFISSFLEKYSECNEAIIYVLFGNQAQTFKPYIKNSLLTLETKHPAYLVRSKQPMPNVFSVINNTLVATNKTPINWNAKE